MPKPEDWKIKVNEEGAPVVDGNKIIFVAPDGKELPLDPPSMYSKIAELNTENRTRREAAEALKATVDLFDGIEDIAKWKEDADKALVTVENFNDKDWMKAEKVEALKLEMSNSYEQKIEHKTTAFNEALGAKDTIIGTKDAQIQKLLVSNNFAVHPLFGGAKPKTKLTPDLAEAYFSKNFRVEENEKTKELSLVAYYDIGVYENPVYSRENPGELATFAEAMDTLWDKYPGKDALMAASGSGSGSGGGTGDDEDIDSNDLASLRKAHAEALKAGNAKLAISLKNKIFKLSQKQNQ